MAIGVPGLVAGLGDGRLFLSQDNGDAWQLLDLRGDPLTSVQALAWAETVPSAQ